MSASEVKELDQLLLVNALLPQSLGLLKQQKISHTCLHVRSSDSLLAVGSNLGHFWVIDTATRKLIRELSDGKSPVRILRFHDEYPLIASATDDGLVTVVNFFKPTMKQLMMERDQRSATAMEWGHEKDRLLVGYNSGKVLAFSVQFDKLTLAVESSVLCDCGSEVVQLSQKENLLLMSTLAKPVLLDMTTGQTTQVGSKGKKAGHFGGTFVKSSAVIARPGLRLWIANDNGEVLSTARFKDVFNSPLPPMTLFGNIATTTVPSDAWQFGRLIPWSNYCIVCYHGNTVWVLDPFTLIVKGVMSLGQKILDVIASGNDLYLLLIGHQRPIVKLSLPVPVVRALPVSVGGAATKDDVDAVESKSKDTAEGGEESKGGPVGGGDKERANEKRDGESVSAIEDIVKEENITNTETTCSDAKEEKSQVSESDKTESIVNKENESSIESSDQLTTPGIPSVIVTKTETEGGKGAEGEEQHVSRKMLGLVVGSGLKGIFAQPLNKLTEFRKELEGQQEEEITEPLPSAPLSTPEAVRRARMLQVEGPNEDTVAVRKKTRRVKKKTGKKRHLHHTPLSSAHSSMDNLDQLNDEVGDSNTPTPTSPSPLLDQRVTEGTDPGRDKGNVSCPVLIPSDRDRIPPKEEVEYPSSTVERSKEEELLSVDEVSSQIKEQSETPEVMRNDVIEAESKWEETEAQKTETSVDNENIKEIEEEMNKEETAIVEETGDSNREKEEEEEVEKRDKEKEESKPKELKLNESQDNSFVLLEPSPIRPDSLIATPPSGIRNRARAFHIDSEDALFSPTSAEEVLLWEESSSVKNPVIPISPTSKTPEHHFPGPPTIQITQPMSVPEHGPPRLWDSYSGSLEETSSHPLGGGGGGSDDDTEMDAINRTYRSEDSMVADDYYALIHQLAGDSRQASSTPSSHSPIRTRVRAGAILPSSQRDVRSSVLITSTDDISEVHSADIWCPVPQPSSHAIQCIAISRTSLWLIDNRRTVYWSNPATGGRDWQAMNKHMSQISSSALGHVVWGVYHQQAYARYGISDLCSSGAEWKKIDYRKKSMVSKSIKWISCDNNTVWAISTDGKIFNRKGVNSSQPEGTVWAEIPQSPPLIRLACCNNIVWGLDQLGMAYVREGISPSSPLGKRWKSVVKSLPFCSITVLDSGIVWGVTNKNKLLFRFGASALDPEGSGPWWEVAVSTLDKLSSTPDPPTWKVMSFERSGSSILHSMTSLLSHPTTQEHLTEVTASSQSGICLLTSNNHLHACWTLASGYHYENACNDKIFELTIWTKVTTANVGLWVVRDDGELYCVVSSDRFERIECQGVIEVLASSPSAVWVLTKGMIWSRQGITDASPQGFSWELIQLGSQMEDFIIHLSMGSNVAWAVDKRGKVYFRFGIHPREPGTGMSPAWVEVDDQLNGYEFKNVSVNSKDWLVWALDRDNVAYIRKGVTPDYPVGKAWERVSGEPLKRISVSLDRVFGLTMSGDLLCRQGITEENPAGIYWTKLPGQFEEIGANPKGELWGIDVRGNLKKQHGKVVSVSSERKRKEKAELEEGIILGECGDWEFL